MAKRGADNYLTDRNWDDETEAEEPGRFQLADSQTLERRDIKKAVRRKLTETSPTTQATTTSVFAGFGGFTSLSAARSAPKELGDTVAPSGSGQMFNFHVGKQKTATSTEKTDDTESSQPLKSPVAVNGSVVMTVAPSSGRRTNLDQLRKLNETVAKWISDHIATNPYCILSPIFTDYQRYLAAIEGLPVAPSGGDKATSCIKSTASPISMTTPAPALGVTTPTPAVGVNTPTPPVGVTKPTLAVSLPLGLFGKASGPLLVDQTGTTEGKSDKTTSGDESQKTTSGAFSFAVAAKNDENRFGEEEEYVPPKPESSCVLEDDAFYSKRCKLFIQKEGVWQERGVGNLHLKPCNNKTQLLIRADTSLGNILLNIMLTPLLPVSRQGKNNVTLICVPNPPLEGGGGGGVVRPASLLLKVKTADDADELLQQLITAKRAAD